MNKAVPVDITGAGCLSGAGATLAECMDSLFEGRRNPAPPTRFSGTHAVPYPVFEVPLTAIPGNIMDSPHISLTGKLALAAAHQAVNDAGLDRAALRGRRVGVCVGTTVGVAMNNEVFYGEFRERGQPRDDAYHPFSYEQPRRPDCEGI